MKLIDIHCTNCDSDAKFGNKSFNNKQYSSSVILGIYICRDAKEINFN